MEEKLTPSQFADELEKLDPTKQHDGSIPKVVSTIILLLRKGNTSSARDTYLWESDKLSYHKEIDQMLKEYFE
jgi:hypothetical protein